MTRQNLEANVRLEAERGDQALAASERLLGLGLLYDSASRGYYAVFHYARALCLTAGEEPRSHQGVAHLLALHLVRPGHLPADTSRIFATLQRFREAADYDAAFVLDVEGATQALNDAKLFVERARGYLKGASLLP